MEMGGWCFDLNFIQNGGMRSKVEGGKGKGSEGVWEGWRSEV